jgi:hypothetical protein
MEATEASRPPQGGTSFTCSGVSVITWVISGVPGVVTERLGQSDSQIYGGGVLCHSFAGYFSFMWP